MKRGVLSIPALTAAVEGGTYVLKGVTTSAYNTSDVAVGATPYTP
jgi:hypothetical protein